MGNRFTSYTKLPHYLELYSQSLKGRADGCNTFQRETKMNGIRGFKKGEISEMDTQTEILTEVNQNGNSVDILLECLKKIRYQ